MSSIKWNSERLDSILSEITATKPIGTTGLESLDSALGGGMYPGVCILAAEPGAGKTSLALHLADYAARFGGRKALFFSLEMSAGQIVAKSISRLAHETAPAERIGIRRIQGYGSQPKPIQDGISAAIEKYREEIAPNMATVDLPLSAEGIAAYVREAANQDDLPPFVVVDYAQLISAEENAQPTDFQLHTSNMRTLCRIAKEQNTPVLVISSLNRNSRGNGKKAGMEGLSGSSELEYGASCVMILERIEDEASAGSPVYPIALRIVKNRFGASGQTLKLCFDALQNRFFDYCDKDGRPSIG